MGGQTALNLALELDFNKVLKKYKVEVLGTSISTINNSENRDLFRKRMKKIHQPVLASIEFNDRTKVKRFIGEVGFPVIMRNGML
jgi:carbamoyl-phosphate synthase large subunit